MLSSSAMLEVSTHIPTTLLLLPDTWFAGLGQAVLLVIAAISIGVVIKGADYLVDGAAAIAVRLGMAKVVVGATIVSLGTTTPEMAVSVLAAYQGNAGLALGNGVGSIIADTGLIFGIGCLMTRLPADRFILKRQGWVQFGSGALLAAICYGLYLLHGQELGPDGQPLARVARWVGVVLVGLLVGYMFISIRWSKQHPGAMGDDVDEHLPEGDKRPIAMLFGIGLIGLAMVVLAGDALVGSVSELAIAHWQVPQVVVAGTLVAFGTSLPELVVGVTSIRKGHPELLVGNVIGADILNVLFVIGAAALAAPLPLIDPSAKVPAIFLLVHLPTMLVMLVLFRVYIAAAGKPGYFARWMGVPMVLLYIAYSVVQYTLST